MYSFFTNFFTKKKRPSSSSSSEFHDARVYSSPIISSEYETPRAKRNYTMRDRMSASRKIQSLFKKNHLQKMCNDANDCLVLGKENKTVNNFFDYFKNFKYMKTAQEIKRGANGIVIKIDYSRLNYNVSSIIKYPIYKERRRTKPDNLIYEYIVGKFFINKYINKLPCFLETYGFFFNRDLNPSSILLDNLLNLQIKNIDQSEVPAILNKACQYPSNYGIITQYINNSKTIDESVFDKIFWLFIIHVLFQVYFALNLLNDSFTHYDLHTNNVLLFKPRDDKYIEYHYYIEGEIISFKSFYLAKIIDYGRSAFTCGDGRFGYRNARDFSSLFIYNILKNNTDCDYSLQGFNFFGFSHDRPDMNIANLNRSQDLRLLYILCHDYSDLNIRQNLNRDFNNLCDNIPEIDYLFDINNLVYFKKAATGESLSGKIYDVMGAFKLIKQICLNPIYSVLNDSFFSRYTKIMDIHIYDDGRDMTYTFS